MLLCNSYNTAYIQDKNIQMESFLFKLLLLFLLDRYDYMCVVTGWDRKCMASLEWIQRMGVDRLERKDHQPFYNVLVNDGSSRYAAQGL